MKFRTKNVSPAEWVKQPKEDCSKEKHGDTCIPDEALTVREILQRYAHGMDLSRLQKFGIYDNEDTDLNDEVLSSRFRDLTELDMYIRRGAKYKKYLEEAEQLKTELLNKQKPVITEPPEPPAEA